MDIIIRMNTSPVRVVHIGLKTRENIMFAKVVTTS